MHSQVIFLVSESNSDEYTMNIVNQLFSYILIRTDEPLQSFLLMEHLLIGVQLFVFKHRHIMQDNLKVENKKILIYQGVERNENKKISLDQRIVILEWSML